MFRTKPKFADWQTPEQRAATVRIARQHDERLRTYCNMMSFWSMCAKPVCRRSRTCSGNMHACFRLHWAEVTEDDKEWVRGALLARRAGVTGVEALARAADAHLADYLKWLESPSAKAAAPASSPEPDASGSAPSADVRIRRL